MNNKFLMVSRLLEYSNADLEKGDTILVGRWKNSPAIIKGFGRDKNKQPIVKTDKGKYSLYRFRIAKLMKESYSPQTDKYFINLWGKIKTLNIDAEVRDGIKNNISKSLDKITKKQIGEIDNIKIMLVNGKEVKQKYDMDFTEGGNNPAKSYIPVDEVWLDSKYDGDLLKTILLHELSERYLMATKGYDYNTAHEFSNKLEKRAMEQQP
jgi:hypothetical protein